MRYFEIQEFFSRDALKGSKMGVGKNLVKKMKNFAIFLKFFQAPYLYGDCIAKYIQLKKTKYNLDISSFVRISLHSFFLLVFNLLNFGFQRRYYISF